MKIRWKALWVVPIYSILAGFLSYVLLVNVLLPITIHVDENGAAGSTPWSHVMLGVVFVAVVLLGGFFLCRRLTRKEIFISTSLLVVFSVILLAIDYITNGNLEVGLLLIDLQPWHHWCDCIVTYLSFMGVNMWIACLARCFAPYIFIPFGKKS